MKFTAIYRKGHSNYQGDFDSEAEFDAWFAKDVHIPWAHLVRVVNGSYIKSVHKPICKSAEFGCECGADDFEPCPLEAR